VDFVYQVNFSIQFAEFVLGVNKYQSFFCSVLAAALKEGKRVLFQLHVIFFRDKPLFKDLLRADILIVISWPRLL